MRHRRSPAALLNGLVIAFGRVPAIVVTLGTMSIFRGLDSVWAGGKQISADKVPQAWLDMTSARIAGVPLMVLIAIAIHDRRRRAACVKRRPAGNSSPSAPTRLAPISSAFPPSAWSCSPSPSAALLAGFAGALWASRYATIDARVAYGFELTVIAAAVVGGVAIRGGAGTRARASCSAR